MGKPLSAPTKHILKAGKIDMEIWQENGIVKQSGQPDLPEHLIQFEDTKVGREKAGAYMAGMLFLSKVMD